MLCLECFKICPEIGLESSVYESIAITGCTVVNLWPGFSYLYTKFIFILPGLAYCLMRLDLCCIQTHGWFEMIKFSVACQCSRVCDYPCNNVITYHCLPVVTFL